MKRFTMLAALFLNLAACSAWAAARPDTGSISGRVSPQGVSVRIIAKLEGTNHRVPENIKGEVVLDKGGAFTIHNLPPGRYDLLFLPQGAAQQEYMQDLWSMIDVEADQTTSGINLRMTPTGSPHMVDEVIVQFRPGTDAEVIARVLSELNCIVKRRPLDLGTGAFYTVDIPDDKTVEEMIQAFQAREEVLSASPNSIYRAM